MESFLLQDVFTEPPRLCIIKQIRENIEASRNMSHIHVSLPPLKSQITHHSYCGTLWVYSFGFFRFVFICLLRKTASSVYLTYC